MIIDTHAHIGKMLIFDMPEEDLLYSIEKYGIDFSLVSNIEGSEFDEHGKPVPDFLVSLRWRRCCSHYWKNGRKRTRK